MLTCSFKYQQQLYFNVHVRINSHNEAAKKGLERLEKLMKVISVSLCLCVCVCVCLRSRDYG